jgi:hypothetical protein
MVVGGELKESGTDGTRETYREIESMQKFLFGEEKVYFFGRPRPILIVNYNVTNRTYMTRIQVGFRTLQFKFFLRYKILLMRQKDTEF